MIFFNLVNRDENYLAVQSVQALFRLNYKDEFILEDEIKKKIELMLSFFWLQNVSFVKY